MITPLNNKIVLKYIEPDITSKSGLIIIDSRGENTDTGIVVAVNSKSALSVNDKVVYNKFAVIPIEYDGESFLLIEEDEILAIM
jgi:co-chaperonin GroES (HSP10)